MEIESNMKKTLRVLTVLSLAASSILFATPSQAAANDVSTVTASSAASILNSSSNGINIVPGSEVIYGSVKSFTSINLGTNFSLANPGIFLNSDSRYGAAISGIPTSISTVMNSALTGTGFGSITDLSALSFDFTVTNPAINSVYLDFLFATEEMLMTIDIAGFIVDGINYAYLSDGRIVTARGATSSGFTRNSINSITPIYGHQASTLVGLINPLLTTHNIVVLVSDTGDTGVPSLVMVSGLTGSTSNISGYRAFGSMTPAPFTPTPTTTAPSAPTSTTASATGKRSATVSFAAPASDGGSAVTSYTATSTPGGITETLTQATGGTFTFDGLEPNTSYTFAVTATNAIGTSAAATSNSIKTLALDVASISALSFADDGTGTGGKIVWAGKDIDAVLYSGAAVYYPGPYNYGAFTSGWNGRIRNLTADTSYTVSIFAVSADGVGESKSLTFKTSAALPELAGSASSTVSQVAQMTAQLPKLFAWIDENTFVEGEGDRMKMMINKFDAIVAPKTSAYLNLPNSSVARVSATSSTPLVCKVEGQLTVRSISAGTCTISYTVSGGSKAPATMIKDFVFKKFG
jgi:hypothetical protein